MQITTIFVSEGSDVQQLRPVGISWSISQRDVPPLVVCLRWHKAIGWTDGWEICFDVLNGYIVYQLSTFVGVISVARWVYELFLFHFSFPTWRSMYFRDTWASLRPHHCIKASADTTNITSLSRLTDLRRFRRKSFIRSVKHLVTPLWITDSHQLSSLTQQHV